MIVAEAADATGEVITVNVPEVEPAEMATEVGTVALVLLEDKLTTVPPVGAGPLRVTVPVELRPPITAAGESATEEREGGLTESVAVRVTPASDAEIVAVAEVVTVTVEIVKEAEVCPLVTETDAGTVTPVVSEDRAIVTPLFGAATLSVMVPVAELPPATDVGAIVNVFGVGRLRTFETRPERIGAPQPEAVSHPGPAFDVLPLGSVPSVPEVTS